MIDALGPFDLDPCAAIGQPWRTATRQYTEDDNGLAQPWDGFVWCNPPYGPQTGVWLSRLADHPDGWIALVFARTETKAFVEHVWGRADIVRFLHGRPHFHLIDGTRAKGNSGGPVCLVGYGPEAVRRLRACALPGTNVLIEPRVVSGVRLAG